MSLLWFLKYECLYFIKIILNSWTSRTFELHLPETQTTIWDCVFRDYERGETKISGSPFSKIYFHLRHTTQLSKRQLPVFICDYFIGWDTTRDGDLRVGTCSQVWLKSYWWFHLDLTWEVPLGMSKSYCQVPMSLFPPPTTTTIGLLAATTFKASRSFSSRSQNPSLLPPPGMCWPADRPEQGGPLKQEGHFSMQGVRGPFTVTL